MAPYCDAMSCNLSLNIAMSCNLRLIVFTRWNIMVLFNMRYVTGTKFDDQNKLASIGNNVKQCYLVISNQ